MASAAVTEPESSAVGADDLLVRHLPILALDRRELFHPTSIDRYVAQASVVTPDGADLGPVDLDDLDHRWGPGTFLRYVTDDDRDVARRNGPRPAPDIVARLGLVGPMGRIVDSAFTASVWLRSTNPRFTTEAALMKANRPPDGGPGFDGVRLDELQLDGVGTADRPSGSSPASVPVCYARSLMVGEWLVLHYAYFYVMNDWRTTYRGLNDHEGDWEQAWLYCDPVDGAPQWLATTSHEMHGPNMRRHWDDPELTRVGGRPILYVSGGSHAMYFRPGDYITRIEVPGLRWFLRSRRLAARMLGLPDRAGRGPDLGVPFVDSARGDGVHHYRWDLRPLDRTRALTAYRGLWGNDPGDLLPGERGPGGPKYGRNGRIRASWADPLGFAGLHGTVPPSAFSRRVNLVKLDRAVAALDRDIRELGRLLPLIRQAGMTPQETAESRRLTGLQVRRDELCDLRERLVNGSVPRGDIRSHISEPAVPTAAGVAPSRSIAAWAVISVPTMLLTVAAVLLLDRLTLFTAFPLLVAAVVTIEYLVGRRLRAAAALAVSVGAGFAATLYAAGPLFMIVRYMVAGGLTVAGIAIMIVNLAEFTGVRPGLRSRTRS